MNRSRDVILAELKYTLGNLDPKHQSATETRILSETVKLLAEELLASKKAPNLTAQYVIEYRPKNSPLQWKESSRRFDEFQEAADLAKAWTSKRASSLPNLQYEYRVREERVWEL